MYVSTSCTSLVKIGPVTLAENRLQIGNCAQPLYDGRRSFSTLALENGLVYRNSHFSALIGHYFYTSCKILMRFGSVTLEFKT